MSILYTDEFDGMTMECRRFTNVRGTLTVEAIVTDETGRSVTFAVTGAPDAAVREMARSEARKLLAEQDE